MEDYIQGVLCGYLTVQNGTRDDAKKTRMFVVLSDARMDYYLTDPRPAFDESIADVYTFSDKTQVHRFVEINPRAPPHSLSLTTDKKIDVYIADSAEEAHVWFTHLSERLEALSQLVVGTLQLRKELKPSQQVQRTLLQSKYTWRHKHVELGRSTIRYCATGKHRPKQRALNQFTLTAESYASEEPVEVLKPVALTGLAVSHGVLSGAELKKLQKDPTLFTTTVAGAKNEALVFPFVVCTGPAHLHLAASSDKERDEWLVAIKLRIIALKYRHNGRRQSATVASTDSGRLHDFMEVQLTPGGPWKRRYVELEHELLKVKLNDRTLGSKLETRLLPTCVVTASLGKANAFVVQNRRQELALAPGTLQDMQRWMQAIKRVASGVSVDKCHKVFAEETKALLAHSVVYQLHVDGGGDAGLVVEKHKKRIFVLSHTPPGAGTTDQAGSKLEIPQGSVLLGIEQVGMLHDSFETIWHKLRQKKGFQHDMKLTFRLPLAKASLVDVKIKAKDRWTLRRCVMRNGKLRIETVELVDKAECTKDERDEGDESSNKGVVLEMALRDLRVEMVPVDDAGVRNALRVTVDGNVSGSGASALSATRSLLLRTHSDGDLFAWMAMLMVECGVAQDDNRYPLTMQTLAKLKQGVPSPLGYLEDQSKQTAKCKVAGQLLSDIDLHLKSIEPKLLARAKVEQQREDQQPPESPVTKQPPVETGGFKYASGLTDADVLQLFQHLDAIGCGKISSSAVSMTMDALTRQLEPQERARVMSVIEEALKKLVPPSRQYVSITLEQTADVLKGTTDPRVVDLVRKFSRHDVQCM